MLTYILTSLESFRVGVFSFLPDRCLPHWRRCRAGWFVPNGISIQQLRFCFTTCMVRIWTYLLFSVVCSKLLCSQKPPENKVQPLSVTHRPGNGDRRGSHDMPHRSSWCADGDFYERCLSWEQNRVLGDSLLHSWLFLCYLNDLCVSSRSPC